MPLVGCVTDILMEGVETLRLAILTLLISRPVKIYRKKRNTF